MKNLITNEHTIKSIFITGASSGIGYQAALKMIEGGHNLILPCRNELQVKSLLKEIKRDCSLDIDISEIIYTPLLDLSDLHSIEKCVYELIRRDVVIDTLVLNAGLQYTGSISPRWSYQNYELTFSVNHLGHQFITQGILPLLLKSIAPRIVITSSEVHNPESPGGKIGQPAGLGELKGLRDGKCFSMIDGSSGFNADKAYKDSKLCNILFAKELSNQLSLQGKKIPVISWAPGLVIPRNKRGFFRYSRKYNELGQLFFSFVVRDILRITETPEKAGRLLAELSVEPGYAKPGFSYYSNKIISPGRRSFEESESSNEANDERVAKYLWQETNNIIEQFRSSKI